MCQRCRCFFRGVQARPALSVTLAGPSSRPQDPFCPILRLDSALVRPVATDVSESSVSLERDSSEDDCALRPDTTPSDGSDAPRRQNQAAVAEAALQDVETLHQLIFRDLEDGWSQDSEDTPTNETANERSPITDELPDPAPSESPGQWGEEPVEAPPLEVLHSPVQVVRKGNMFYLVMPKDQWSALTGH